MDCVGICFDDGNKQKPRGLNRPKPVTGIVQVSDLLIEISRYPVRPSALGLHACKVLQG